MAGTAEEEAVGEVVDWVVEGKVVEASAAAGEVAEASAAAAVEAEGLVEEEAVAVEAAALVERVAGEVAILVVVVDFF